MIAYVEGNFFADACRIVSPSASSAGRNHEICFSFFLSFLGLFACRAGTDRRDRSPRRTRNQIATGRRSRRNEISAFEAGSSCSGAQGQKGRTTRYGVFFLSLGVISSWNKRGLTAELDMRVRVVCFFFFRRILWRRRCGSTQHRRHDGRFDGSDRVHEVHRRTLYGLKEIKVRSPLNRAPVFAGGQNVNSRSSSRQSSRSRRKAERKVGSGRKGTVDEEEYLLQSIVKMCSRLATVQGTRGNAKKKKLPFFCEREDRFSFPHVFYF